MCREVHFMCWGNQESRLQDWEDWTKFKKTRILDINKFVPNNNTPLYIEHVISSIAFAFGEGFNIIDWLANMKL